MNVIAGREGCELPVVRFDTSDGADVNERERSVLRDESVRLRAVHRARRASREPTALAAGKRARVERACSLIENSLCEPLRIRDLAAVAYMSPYHFSRLFKHVTGESPHVYLMARRIERAKGLLAAQALPLVQVAFAVGFRTQGHFTEVFHRHTGTTPRKYRLAARASRDTLSMET
jgi:AraC family transcriptional regulator